MRGRFLQRHKDVNLKVRLVRPGESKLELRMATTTTHVPVEVYLRSSYEPDAEYVDGAIEERAVGENDHSAWQEAI